MILYNARAEFFTLFFFAESKQNEINRKFILLHPAFSYTHNHVSRLSESHRPIVFHQNGFGKTADTIAQTTLAAQVSHPFRLWKALNQEPLAVTEAIRAYLARVTRELHGFQRERVNVHSLNLMTYRASQGLDPKTRGNHVLG